MLKFLKESLFGRPRPPLAQQLASLADSGIAPLDAACEELVLRRCAGNHLRHEPYMALLLELGGGSLSEDADGPDIPLSHDVWHFDTECIVSHGDYIDIARRFTALSKGALVLTDVRDHVDIEEGVAWLSFRIDGKEVRWDLAVEDDWVDPNVFSRFELLLAQTGSQRRYIWFDLQGQDCLVACVSAEQQERLKLVTGLETRHTPPA